MCDHAEASFDEFVSSWGGRATIHEIPIHGYTRKKKKRKEKRSKVREESDSNALSLTMAQGRAETPLFATVVQ